MSSGPDLDSVDLLDFAALERCAENGTLERLLAVWSPRLAAAGQIPTDPETRARAAVLRALRLDLPLFVRDPSLLFACLYNRLVWVDDPAAAPFYGDPVPANAAPPLLRPRLEQWWAERRAAGKKAPWARALRPPYLAHFGPHVEEYREALGPGVAFSADGSAVGVIDERGRAAWDRRSGRRLGDGDIARLFAPPPEARFELEHADFGRLRARDRQGGPGVALDLDGDSSIHHLAELPEGGLCAAGWCYDDDGVVFRLDSPYSEVRWRAVLPSRIEVLAACPSGRWIAAADGAYVRVLDAATGQAVVHLPARATALAFDRAGTLLAVRHGDLIQIWDIARGAAPAATLDGCDQGRIDAQFSPDGRRLITGRLLCDAESGRLVARLDVDSRGYLEGGPPETGRLLADGRFVEMAPLRGVCVWESERGERIKQDVSRRYGHRDNIVIAPDGLSYAHIPETFFDEPAAQAVELRRSDDGEPLATLPMPDPKQLRFSPDGARLFAGSGSGELRAWSTADGRELLRLSAHSTEITEIVVSLDGAQVVTAGLDGVLRLWDAGGRPLGERVLGGHYAPGYSEDGASMQLTWTAGTETIESIDGWLGFKAIAHPYSARRRHGLVEITDRRTGEVRARVLTHEDLIADASGKRWAYRALHVAIEDE